MAIADGPALAPSDKRRAGSSIDNVRLDLPIPLIPSVLAALAIALIVSTQFLFQPFVWRHWPLDEILLGWLEVLRDRTVVAVTIALAFSAAQQLLLASDVSRSAALAMSIAVGALLGESLLMGLGAPAAASGAAALLGRALRWSVVAAAVAALIHMWLRAARSVDTLRRLELARLDSEGQLTHLRLQTLRTQIEPHFLFNTLATVRRLGTTDPALHTQLLDHLHNFIRLSLAAGPNERVWRLGQEIELVRSYLGVVDLRMNGRLAVAFEVEPGVQSLSLPPLLVATLVENAVKHGITPSTEGGSITVGARRDGAGLEVTVADTGVGFQSSTGSGIGLANTRARLRTLYGERAVLDLRANQPCGVVAVLRLPIEVAAP